MAENNLVIIGGGPAGVSAAIYAKRAGIREVSIININNALGIKEYKIDNYYGFPDGIFSADLMERGLNQAKNLGINIVLGEAVSLEYDYKDMFYISYSSMGETSIANARGVVLAMGSARKQPNILGFSKFEGKGISYCATCDGYFFKNKRVAVLGNGDFAVKEAKELLPLAKDVVLLTNAKEFVGNEPRDVEIINEPIREFFGEEKLAGVSFVSGDSIDVEGLFIALGTLGSQNIAKKIGVLQDKQGNIVVDHKGGTNIPLLYAAGDCIGGLLQVANAVMEGARAGKNIALELLK